MGDLRSRSGCSDVGWRKITLAVVRKRDQKGWPRGGREPRQEPRLCLGEKPAAPGA